MIGLALANLRDRGFATALNVALLATAVATLVLLLSLSHQIGGRFERDARGIDLVVGAKGSPLQLVLSSVYHVDQPTGNVPLSSLELLRRDPGVARVVPVALGDNFRGYRIVGTEPAYLALRHARLSQGRLWQASGDAVIGAEVARRTGAALGQRFVGSHGLDADGEGHDAHPFTVTGVLAPTGGVADRLILTSIESVWDVHDIAHDDGPDDADAAHAGGHADHNLHEAHEAEPEVTALLVTYRNAAAALRIPASINRQSALQSAAPAIEAARLLSLLGSGFAGARVFGWLLAALGGLTIFAAVLSATRARAGELALLRVMGARRVQVFGTILFEGVAIALVAAILGGLAAHALLAVAAARFDTLAEVGIAAWQVSPGEPLLLLAAVAIGELAALVPALAVYRSDLAVTLSRSS